jgi:enamine deaminase RidA (YjgF/YER057c/UK114 family)
MWTPTALPALASVPCESSDPSLSDLIVLNGIQDPESVGKPFASQCQALFKKVERTLADKQMTKDHIVDLKTTLAALPENLKHYNELYDAWMAGVDILPTQTAAQIVHQDPSSAPLPAVAMSITATKATKRRMPNDNQRAGGGEAVDLGNGVAFHYCWSKVVPAGDLVWVCGLLNTGPSEPIKQAQAVIGDIDDLLKESGIDRSHIIRAEVLVPNTMSSDERKRVVEVATEELQMGNSRNHVRLHAVARTCLDCLVEISVIARTTK